MRRGRCAGSLEREGSGITHDIRTPGALDSGKGTEGVDAGAAPAIGIAGVAERLVSLSLDLLVTAGFDGYIKHANPAFERTLGWTAEDLRTRPYLEFMHPDDRERVAAEALALASGDHETRDFELRFAHRDGGWRRILISAQAGPEEQLLYAVGKDITDRREAEERFRSAFENAAIGMSMTSTEGRFLRVNRALCEMTGYSEDELTGRAVHDVTHPDDVEADVDAMRRLATGEIDTFRTEKRYLRRDGSHLWVSLSSSAVPGVRDAPLYFISQMEDISERRRVELELRDAARRFETVTESANDAIVSAEEDGRIAFWNDRARTMFGYEPEDILGKELATLMPDRFRDQHRKGFARYLKTGRAHVIGRTIELVGLRSDGTEFPLELSLGEWRRGERRAFTGVIRDLTERQRTERYLAAQFRVASVLAESPTLEDAAPRFLAAIGESMGWQVGGLWTPEPDGRHLRCRAGWYEAEGEVEAFRQATMESAFERGEGLPGRVWDSGEPVWIRDAGSEPNFPRAGAAAESGLHGAIGLPLFSGGEIVGAVDFFGPQIQEPDPALIELMGTIGAQLGGFIQRMQAQGELAVTAAELRDRAAELERSNADLEQFAYVASHDLSEPLRMVAGFAQLLQKRYEGRLDADADEFIGYTVDGVNRMQALIDDLLAFSRVGRDRELGDVDAELVARRALEALSASLAETGADVEIGDLPTVRGDERELGQLFQNLISNAVKFHGDEPPRVWVTAEAEAGGAEWRFAVADNGIGIEPRHAERIFKMFQRLHGRDDYPGTGVGLAICKKIVEHHGGRLWVEPNVDGGSVFKFTLAASEGDSG
jgi:PAS domain S-box-containing protein